MRAAIKSSACMAVLAAIIHVAAALAQVPSKDPKVKDCIAEVKIKRDAAESKLLSSRPTLVNHETFDAEKAFFKSFMTKAERSPDTTLAECQAALPKAVAYLAKVEAFIADPPPHIFKIEETVGPTHATFVVHISTRNKNVSLTMAYGNTNEQLKQVTFPVLASAVTVPYGLTDLKPDTAYRGEWTVMLDNKPASRLIKHFKTSPARSR